MEASMHETRESVTALKDLFNTRMKNYNDIYTCNAVSLVLYSLSFA